MLNVAGPRNLYLSIALVIIVASAAVLAVNGLKFGIDFEGGTLLERGLPGVVEAEAVRAVLVSEALADYGLGGSVVQPLEESSDDHTVVLIRARSLEDADAVAAIDRALAERFGEVSVRRTEVVGPVIGQELVRQALIALGLGLVGILIYISVRFEPRFGAASVVALFHDVMVVLGVFALLGREVNTPFVAAILTVVGYSINATIVIFDRIRENRSFRRWGSVEELVNASINQTLGRTINTSLTTLFVIASLYVLGGSSIKDFSLALLVGVVAGTFSSLFVASPLWIASGGSRAAHKPARAA